MNEPQVWTLIGVFATGMCGTIALVATMFVRIVRSEFAIVRTEFAMVRTEIKAVHGRIDHLDRDVSAIYRHLFGIERS